MGDLLKMSNTGDYEDSSVQLPGHAVTFSRDMDVFSLTMFLGDNGIPSDVCEVFEGEFDVCDSLEA